MIIEETLKVGKRGQITIPTMIRKKERINEGDFLAVNDVGGVLTLRKVEKKPSVVDLFTEVGMALRNEGVSNRRKALELVEKIKQEAGNEAGS